MKRALLLGSMVLLTTWAFAGPHGDTPTVTAEQALTNLKQGNQRFFGGQTTNPNTDNSRRIDTAKNGQHPFAAVLTCADSRVPCERVFDAGVGDIFTVRVAGNIADTNEIGSLEYAAEHLSTPLIVVMGHEKCGAVAAAASHAELHGNTATLVRKIEPAVASCQQQNPNLKGDELLAAAIRANVNESIQNMMEKSSTLANLVSEKKLQIVGAVYNIETGQIEWLSGGAQASLTSSPKKSKAVKTTDGHDHDSHD